MPASLVAVSSACIYENAFRCKWTLPANMFISFSARRSHFVLRLFHFLAFHRCTIFHFALFLCLARCEPFANRQKTKKKNNAYNGKSCYIDHQLFCFVLHFIFLSTSVVWTAIDNGLNELGDQIQHTAGECTQESIQQPFKIYTMFGCFGDFKDFELQKYLDWFGHNFSRRTSFSTTSDIQLHLFHLRLFFLVGNHSSFCQEPGAYMFFCSYIVAGTFNLNAK